MWQHLPCQLFPTLSLQSAKLRREMQIFERENVFSSWQVTNVTVKKNTSSFLNTEKSQVSFIQHAPTNAQLDLTFRQWHAVSANTHLHDVRADHFHLFLASGRNVNIPSLPSQLRLQTRAFISAWQQSAGARLLVTLIRLPPLINLRPRRGWSRSRVPSFEARAAVSRRNQDPCPQTT